VGEVAQDRVGTLDLRVQRWADPLQLFADRLAAHLVFVLGQVAHDVELAQAFELAAQLLAACGVAVRRAFQLGMPRLILNGGTSDSGFYQVTSHDFLTEACLGCISRADLQSASAEESLARRLGVQLGELQPHLDSAEPLPCWLLAQLSPVDAGQLRGVPGREVARVACGHLRPLPDELAHSAPMLSAAPGILLAAEIVKRLMVAYAPLSAMTNMVATSILNGPHQRWALQRHKSSDCTCQDPAYRAFYQRRWGNASAAGAS
jgi:hypothetical protein